MTAQHKKRGFVSNGLIALKNYILEPKLSFEEKRFIKENFKASQQEIRDLISGYFYMTESGLYDIKDDIFREPIAKLIKINSVIHLKGYKILEKYFEGKEEKDLEEKEQKIFDLMINFSATQSLYHSTFTEAEKSIAIRGRQIYGMLEDLYHFELLEKYFANKERERLAPEDQALYDVIQKYGAERQPGERIVFLEKGGPENDPFNLLCEIHEDTEIDIEISHFYKGVHRYNALENVEKIPDYETMSYPQLKAEQSKLYTELKEKEKHYGNKS